MSDDPFRPAPAVGAPSGLDPIAPPPTPVSAVVRPRTAARSGTFLNGILVVAALVAVGGVAFGVGRATAPAAAGATGTGRTGFGTGNGNFGNGNGGPNGSSPPAGATVAGSAGSAGSVPVSRSASRAPWSRSPPTP